MAETLKLIVVDSKYVNKIACLISEESDSESCVPYRPNGSVNLFEYGLALQG
jgi:hypothetical protein